MSGDLLARVLGPEPPPFAVVHRPETALGTAEILVGTVHRLNLLAELPVPDRADGPTGHDLLVVVPYRQLAERGFACPDDGAPLLAMTVDENVSSFFSIHGPNTNIVITTVTIFGMKVSDISCICVTTWRMLTTSPTSMERPRMGAPITIAAISMSPIN